VQVLRDFRDGVLLKTHPGRWFVVHYYLYSPPLAAVVSQNESLRFAVRAALTPVVYTIEYPKVSGLILLFGTGLMFAFRQRRKFQKK